MAQECRSPGCFKCGKKHHPSICESPQSSYQDTRIRESGTQKRQAEDTAPNKKPRDAQEAHKGKRQVEGSRQYPYQKRGAKVNEITNETSSEPDTEEYVGHIASKEKTKTVLLTGVAKIQGKKGSKNVRILFDTRSELSFIGSKLTQELQLPQIGEERLRINTFGSKKAEIETYPIVEADLFDGDERKYQVTLYASPKVTSRITRPRLEREDLRFIKEKGIRIAETGGLEAETPSILLGCDQLWSLVEGSKYILPSGMHLISTKFGFMLSGKIKRPQTNGPPNVMFTSEQELEQWDNYWKMDSSGIEEFHGPEREEKEQVNERVLRRFNDTIRKKKDGYYVRLPWKEQHEPLPDNKSIALARLHGIYNRYKDNPKVLDDYDKVFKDQLQKGILEEVSDQEDTDTIKHYLPHKPVFTPSKATTKMRIVFDASAHLAGKPSLNDVLYKGPLILPKLQGMMLRFRTGKIAIVSDVEKAFLQVRLHKADRDATRCIWLRDVNKPPEVNNLVTYRFTRVTFGLNASPFLLSATIRFHLESEQDTRLAKEIDTNLYVDNLFMSAETAEEGIQKYRNTKDKK
ncbi:hypothetical protein Y032_0813g2483 [Ancylostoma ceylanicum]|uniref:Uncharacterized protein n=1 Tax=Ancylostoma ceylanicum TaxID=53326 RepID=A0A016WD62_9BILA|nr:hypothetical protein Y032_0813g2483 [Ancylostoma ceylanicum]